MGSITKTSTTCVIAGGGPAGTVLGLLLARSGIDVAVLEKHPDFLRDFRGDTVHASTLALLDELGLGERFAALPHRREPHLRMHFDEGSVTVAFDRLPGRHRHIALVPQWDLLTLLADAADASPHFHLARSAEVTGLIRRDDGRVCGVRYLDRDTGDTHELRAALVVGTDGRHSTVRRLLGAAPRSGAAPHDCLYLRLPRADGDPEGSRLHFGSSGGVVMIDRGDYWQIALIIGKGEAEAALAQDAAWIRRALARSVPGLKERAATVRAEDVAVLQVRIDRLRRWWAPGVLLIGDAAHAMSPIAGVGINLAVQDAVAAARILVPALRRGEARPRDLARVQRRRWWPTVLTQAAQKQAEKRVVPSGSVGARRDLPPLRTPQPIRTLNRWKGFPHLMGRLVGIGLRPEHLTGPLAPLRVAAPDPERGPFTPPRRG
ncbi:FAD-dependent oxidoreductase [Nocardiopsis sp. RSe5-2]|uniref:FAD-dependent oxidoreductase n=1 Tax=Nocardiopsis endophytica TaxID=3018445 RepID=A0ABT4TWL7_9ACTN|nr:FAD-dependent oxidoreductase [Nocardiopsis endophytica]MDA2809108.1 FAD-dependent oxidoreductase [Nocardiopsis endophytica]